MPAARTRPDSGRRAASRADEDPAPSAHPAPGGRSVCLVSLGCSKNLVDSEVMVGHLGRAGVTLVTEPEDARVVIVNTCGFIGEAREESVDTILRYAALKERGDIEGLVVTGCLVELHAKELAAELPEVDAFLPLSDYSGVPSIVDQVLGVDAGAALPTGSAAGRGGVGAGSRAGGAAKQGDSDLGRALLTPTHTAYLRLGEGCNHVCAFCAIPKIRGRLKSKPLEVLVEEATALARLGTRELTLIAEDSTDYGKDLERGYGLADLLRALGDVEGLAWVRVMYAHPATMDEGLAAAMAETPNVLPYVDMPVQHGDEVVLKRMRRGTSPARIRRAVGWLRDAMPDITLRTTILVGFPGETERRFGHLLELLDELAFDRVGCFAFSPEEGTEGATLGARVPRRTAEARRRRVMEWQRRRMVAAQKARVGQVETVLVDAVDGELAVGRTRRDAPEVDGRVLLSLPAPPAGRGARRAAGKGRGKTPARRGLVLPGDFVEARMTGVKGYDLTGTLSAP